MSTNEPAGGALRSLLFAPGNEPRKVAKLATAGAAAVAIDLEDAVAASSKAQARAVAAEHLAKINHAGLTMVRINGLGTGLADDDLDSVVRPGLDAVVVPKVESPEDIEQVDLMLAARERARGLPLSGVKVLALVETARGIAAVERIAGTASHRLLTLILGSGDLATDLNLQVTPDGAELAYARSRLVLACRAHRLAPPLDGPYLRFRDLDGLRADCERSRAFGCGGRVVVHPAQVAVANGAYGESEDDLASLREIVDAFEEAEGRGIAAIDVAGGFVDYPVYEQARRRLHQHESTIEERTP